MQIARVDVIPITIPLTTPVRMATHTITSAANVLVRIEGDDGTVGWGEAAEASNMTGDLQAGIVAAARRLATHYRDADPRRLRALGRAADRDMVANTSAKSALDMAAHDLAARGLGVPLHDVLGGAVRTRIPALCIVGTGDPDTDAARAADARAEGHREFKLKVGMAGIDVDVDAAAAVAVRDAIGSDAVLGAHANQSMTVARAVRFLHRSEVADLRYLEQPLPGADRTGLIAIRSATNVGIGLDEGLHAVDEILDHAAAGAIDGIALKLIKDRWRRGDHARAGPRRTAWAGGQPLGKDRRHEHRGGRADLHRGRGAGDRVGLLGHQPRPGGRCGADPDHRHRGSVDVPGGPGLGVDVDEDAVTHYRVTDVG